MHAPSPSGAYASCSKGCYWGVSTSESSFLTMVQLQYIKDNHHVMPDIQFPLQFPGFLPSQVEPDQFQFILSFAAPHNLHYNVQQSPCQAHWCPPHYLYLRNICYACQCWKGTEYQNKTGMCDDKTFCLNTWVKGKRIWDEKRDIICVPIQKSTGTQPTDPQTGMSDPMKGVNNLGRTQHVYTLNIDHAMIGASVSAVLTSECRSSLSYVSRESIGFRFSRPLFTRP